MSADNFVYEIPFEAKAKVTVNKWQIVTAVAMRVGRHLTTEEGNKVWADIQRGEDWKAVFPLKQYSTDKLDFAELLREDIENAAEKIINDVWDNVYDDALKTDLDKLASDLHVESEPEEITLANVEIQTQKRIQDDNVRNGLARCANETKKKSIEKWKRNYFLMQHNLDIQNISLPDGKTEEDFIKHLEGFLKN
jgi:hypothetical protein